MVQPKNQTEVLLLSITENCETLFKQTHAKAEEALEYTFTKQREFFHFNPPISIEGSWLVGLTSLEVYNSIFNITSTNIKLELDEFSFEDLENEVEEIFDKSNITQFHLQRGIIETRIFQAYKEVKIEKIRH